MLYIKNATIYTPDQVIARAACWSTAGHRRGGPGGHADLPARRTRDRRGRAAPGARLHRAAVQRRLRRRLHRRPRRDLAGRRQLPRYGVTAFLPTIITSPLEKIAAGQAVVTAGRPADFRGAAPARPARRRAVPQPAEEGRAQPEVPAPAERRGGGRLVARHRRPPGDAGAGAAGRAGGDRGALGARGPGERRPFDGDLRGGGGRLRGGDPLRHAPVQRHAGAGPSRSRPARRAADRRPADRRLHRRRRAHPPGDDQAGLAGAGERGA